MPTTKEKAAAIKAKQDAAKKTKDAQAKSSAGTDAKPGTADLEKSLEKLRRDVEETESRLAKAKEGEFQKFDESTLEIGGVKKQLREEGDSNTGKAVAGHVVQQGGGGAAIAGDTGAPIR